MLDKTETEGTGDKLMLFDWEQRTSNVKIINNTKQTKERDQVRGRS
jgi:hypothetical protein